MQKEELGKKIEQFKASVESGSAEVNVMLVEQNNQRKQIYKGLMLRTTREDLREVLYNIFKITIDEIKKRTLNLYDLEISVDESIQMVNDSDVIHGNEILEQLTLQYTESNTVTRDTDLSKISFMVIQIYNGNESIYLFKKYIQPTTAYRKTYKYLISGNELKLFNEKIISISSEIDAFYVGSSYYIFNRNAFNSIFQYKDVFKKILEQNVEVIKNSGILTESEQFIEDCENNGRYLPRLIKVILAKGFDEVYEKKKNIPQVIKDYNLSLKLSETGEIIYKGKEDIPEVLNLLLCHYVIDALTSNKMIAMAIQDYQAGNKGGDQN